MSASPTAALGAAVLALALAACGGEEESSGNASQGSSSATATQQRTPEPAEGGQAPSEGDARQGRGGGDASAEFTPRPHEDSGGGSEQFRVRGGDNSVQEFGEEAQGEEFEQAAAALHGFYDARAQRAWGAACEYLAAPLVASLEGGETPAEKDDVGCAQGLRRFTNPKALKLLRAEARQVDVASLRAEGDSGFLLYRDGKGTVYAIAVVREDGEWKVANLAGFPLG